MTELFHSPSGGLFSLREVIEEMLRFMGSEPGHSYRVIIGSDSQEYKNGSTDSTGSPQASLSASSSTGAGRAGDTDFVSVVVVHRVGRGGRYFWFKERLARMLPLREKIYEEATRSLMLAMALGGELKESLGRLETFQGEELSYTVEIHVDIGANGPTREMIREIVGMIRGSGFVVRTKPEAYAASTVADRYT